MNILFIQQHDILNVTIIKGKSKTWIFLNHTRFLNNTAIGFGNVCRKESFPFTIIEDHAIQ